MELMSMSLRGLFEQDDSWRILPLDAAPEDKFVADMVFKSLDKEMFPGHTVAHGYIYNDSRGLFRDGDKVRTSSVKRVVEIDGHIYIETRNTMYKLIGDPANRAKSLQIGREHDQRGWEPK